MKKFLMKFRNWSLLEEKWEIKKIGKFSLSINLHSDVLAELQVLVEKKENEHIAKVGVEIIYSIPYADINNQKILATMQSKKFCWNAIT